VKRSSRYSRRRARDKRPARRERLLRKALREERERQLADFFLEEAAAIRERVYRFPGAGSFVYHDGWDE
jgi:hypothetical protein